MAEESLRIKIGADVADFEKAIDKVEKDMKGIQPVVTTTGKSFSDFGKAVTKTATDVQKLPDAAGKASNVLSNLSRVASDAPFGFIAIQNNLDPLIQSFGSLQRESGGTGTAIKALAGSLAGPAGLAVGFSIVSSLVTSAIQKYGSLGNAITALTTTNKELFQSQLDLANIRTDAAKDAATEITQLNLLSKVATDTTNKQENRIEATKKLLSVYKEYLPNVKEEAILNGLAAAEITKVKDAILQKALASAAEKKAAEIGAKLLDNQLKQLDAVNSYGAAVQQLAQQRSKSDKEGLKNAQGLNTQTLQYANEVLRAKGIVADLGKESVALNKQYETLLSLASGFAKEAGGAFISNKEIEDSSKGQISAQQKILETILKRYKAEQEAIKITSGIYSQSYLEATKKVLTAQANLDIFKVSKDSGAVKAIRDNLNAQLDALDAEFKKRRFEAGSIDFTPIFKLDKAAAQQRLRELAQAIAAEGRKSLRLPEDIYGEALKTAPKKLELKPQVVFSADVKKQIEEQSKKAFNLELLQQRVQEAAQIFSNVVNPIFDNLFTSLEKGENVFKSLGESVKQFVIGAIKQFVKLAAVAGLISLVTGVPFSAAFKTVAGGGGGGGFFGGGFSGSAPLGGLSGGTFGVNVGGQFNIRGTDLVAVVNQGTQRIGRVG
jgi:hypothetical protein